MPAGKRTIISAHVIFLIFVNQIRPASLLNSAPTVGSIVKTYPFGREFGQISQLKNSLATEGFVTTHKYIVVPPQV